MIKLQTVMERVCKKHRTLDIHQTLGGSSQGIQKNNLQMPPGWRHNKLLYTVKLHPVQYNYGQSSITTLRGYHKVFSGKW